MDERDVDCSALPEELLHLTLSKSINKNMDERDVDWSVLPEELLRLINPARVDAVRFRSVCASWRSSIPPPCEILPPLPLPLPCPTRSARRAYVSHRTFYRFKLPDDVNPTCSSKSWLVKVEEFEFGRKCLLNPLPNLRFGFPFPKRINLLDYQVVEVSKEYKLQSISGMPIVGVNKLVLFPDSAWNSCAEDTVIFALYDDRKLGCVKYGDKNWTLVDDLDCDDIIVYKGKPYVVDTWGTVSWIDSSMKLIQFSPPHGLVGDQRHLVESCGELYVVDRFFDDNLPEDRVCPKTIHFQVYKLDQEWVRWVRVKNSMKLIQFSPLLGLVGDQKHLVESCGELYVVDRFFDDNLPEDRVCPKTIHFQVYKVDQEWDRLVRVKNLGDQVFFLGKDSSFSVSATEFSGCKGNCIYFTDEDGIGAFDQKTGKIVDFQDRCHLFWPPPSWLNVEFK